MKLSGSMEYFISRTHWLDALTPPLEKHLQQLADVVRRFLARSGDEGKNAATDILAAEQQAVGVSTLPLEAAPSRNAWRALRGWLAQSRTRLALGLGGAGSIAVVVAILLFAGGGGGGAEPAALALSPTPSERASATPATETPDTAVNTPQPAASQDVTSGGAAPPIGQADEFAIIASPECVAPAGRLEATWTAVDRQTGDWIGLLPAAARNDEYAKCEWNYVSTVGGRVVYPAPSAAGEFEFRLVRSGSHLAVSNSVTVRDGCPVRATTAELDGYSATATPACVEPGGRIEATWNAADRQTGDWIGLLPASRRNDEYSDIEWNYVSTAGGSQIYPAPSSPGEYEVRLVRPGTHLAVSQPITASDNC